jgi:hypothetical protein
MSASGDDGFGQSAAKMPGASCYGNDGHDTARKVG